MAPFNNSANCKDPDREKKISQAWAEADREQKKQKAEDRRAERLSASMGIAGLFLILFFPGAIQSVYKSLETLHLAVYVGSGFLLASACLPKLRERDKKRSRVLLFSLWIEQLSKMDNLLWKVSPRVGQLIFSPFDVVITARRCDAPMEWSPLYEVVIPIPEMDILTRQCNFSQLSDSELEVSAARNSYRERHAFYP